MYLIHLSFL